MVKPVNTAGDVARKELAQLGLAYFQEAEQRQRTLLEGMRHEQRTAFAAAVAERLLRAHEGLPSDQRKPYTLGWRGLLDAVWRGLADDDQAFDDVSAVLARFYLSPQHHNRGQDGPNEADDDAVAATYYAAECFLHGCTDFAAWAAHRGVEAAVRVAEGDAAWWARQPADVSEFGWVLAHPACQGELARQLEDLGRLAERGDVLGGGLGSDDEAIVMEFDRQVRQHTSFDELIELVAVVQPHRAELLKQLRRSSTAARDQ
jgi:hypothetical protein